jgi:hypothetical protein
VSLPAYFVAVLLGGGWLTTVAPPASAAAPPHPAAAAPQAPQPPIVIDAAFSRVDYKTNTAGGWLGIHRLAPGPAMNSGPGPCAVFPPHRSRPQLAFAKRVS